MAAEPVQQAADDSKSETTTQWTDPNLQAIEGSSEEKEEAASHPDGEERVHNVLKATLQVHASTNVKGAKLAEDIVYLIDGAASVSEAQEPADIWWRVLLIAGCTPPHHPWHSALIEAIKLLRQREGTMVQNNPNTPPWKELCDLSLVLVELYEGFGFTDADDMTIWRNQNHFVPRLLREIGEEGKYAFAYWQLRHTLESPLSVDESADGKFCHIWVASSWLIEQGDRLFAEATSGEEVEIEGSLSTGPLCSTKKPLSRERWEFWKERLPEVLAEVIKELGKSDEDTAAMVQDALKRMEEVEK